MLSKRLLALANFIDDNETVADIGSDHALLLCHLANSKRLKRGYAFDIAPGPLKQAIKNITEGSYNNISCILADGLSKLPDDTTVVVIAGMGYKTISEILSTNWDRLPSIKYVIVQCNSQVTSFRNFLAQKKANIIDELWIKDYKDYQFIKFNLAEEKEYSKEEIYFGPVLLEKKPDDFLLYYKKHYDQLKKNYRLNQSEEIKETILLIEESLKDFF